MVAMEAAGMLVPAGPASAALRGRASGVIEHVPY